jgi:hypothetical protein
VERQVFFSFQAGPDARLRLSLWLESAVADELMAISSPGPRVVLQAVCNYIRLTGVTPIGVERALFEWLPVCDFVRLCVLYAV